jgi:hypothetical protein
VVREQRNGRYQYAMVTKEIAATLFLIPHCIPPQYGSFPPHLPQGIAAP